VVARASGRVDGIELRGVQPYATRRRTSNCPDSTSAPRALREASDVPLGISHALKLCSRAAANGARFRHRHAPREALQSHSDDLALPLGFHCIRRCADKVARTGH